jgi:hypothetical protein
MTFKAEVSSFEEKRKFWKKISQIHQHKGENEWHAAKQY